MSAVFLRRSLMFLVAAAMTAMFSSCALHVDGRGYDGERDYWDGYYYPPDVDYGGWGHDYHVAPERHEDNRPRKEEGHESEHAYRPAPVHHPVPTIPSKSRSDDESRSH
jgi:hypothetical protein